MKTENYNNGFRQLFITGCYRSGTTLVEKLLHNHPNITVASQPFPVFYFYVKSIFNQINCLSRRYPLTSLFLEDGYSSSEFHNFLNEYTLSDDNLNEIFNQLLTYDKGLWTREILAHRSEFHPGTFLEVFNELNNFIAHLYGTNECLVSGSKEVLCEEFIPYFLKNDVKVILIIRDPRDMIASLNFGNRDNLTGDHRPVLYSLRIWRKSVAFALAFQSHRNFLWLRYCDLVDNSEREISRITDFLSVAPYQVETLQSAITGQNGREWSGNSSFDNMPGVSAASINRYREVLDSDLISYIEACCLPEMLWLRYSPDKLETFDPEIVRDYRDSFDKIHEKFPADYSHKPEHIAEEIQRVKYLQSGEKLSEVAITQWFIHPRVYTELAGLISAC